MSTLNVKAAIDALQTIHAGIAGIEFAPLTTDQMPNSIKNFNLPCVLIHLGAGEATMHAQGSMKGHIYTLEVSVYVLPTGQGDGPFHEGNDKCIDLIDLFISAYANEKNTTTGPALGGAVESLDNITHGGVQPRLGGQNPMLWAGRPDYWGFTFQIDVKQKEVF